MRTTIDLPDVNVWLALSVSHHPHQARAPGDLPARLLTDAYLAAHPVSGGMRLVSFDRDFRRFPGLNLLLLKPEALPQ